MRKQKSVISFILSIVLISFVINNSETSASWVSYTFNDGRGTCSVNVSSSPTDVYVTVSSQYGSYKTISIYVDGVLTTQSTSITSIASAAIYGIDYSYITIECSSNGVNLTPGITIWK